MKKGESTATWLSSILPDAFRFALIAHGKQVRKGTAIPYLSHPMAVASIVLEHGGTEEQAAAALLHDVIEDTDATYQDLEREFGAAVADIVQDCTDADTKPKPKWRPRKEKYLEHLRHVGLRSLLVSAADKLHNARAIVRDVRQQGKAVWSRFNATPAEILWYYESMAAVFRDRAKEAPEAFGLLVGELEAAVDEMGRLAK